MSRAGHVAGPGLAPPVLGDAGDRDAQPREVSAFPFDAGPYDRLPLGAFSTDRRVARKRAIIVVLVAWVPLLVLSALEGRALAAMPEESFLLDIPAYARYLVTLPLLILAERVTLPKLGAIARQFGTSGLVPASEQQRYSALLASTRRLLSSPVTTIVILTLAYVLTLWVAGRIVVAEEVSTWAVPIAESGPQVSLAGWWRALVSQPLYVANVAQKVLIEAGSVMQFKTTVAFVVGFVLLLFVAPLLVLRGPLQRLRSKGILTYGELAADLGQRFEARWLKPGGDVSDKSMEASDFSAVTDAYAIVANVGAIRLNPIDHREAALLVLVSLLPFVPLLLVMVPVAELLAFAANFLL